MAFRDYLGEFEQIVLLAVARLGDEGYGMSIRREIEETAGRSVSIGAVYATLERLEKKSLVSTRFAVVPSGSLANCSDLAETSTNIFAPAISRNRKALSFAICCA